MKNWWYDNIVYAKRSIYNIPAAEHTIYQDASNEGWDACDGSSTINGRWLDNEKVYHIELLAVKVTLVFDIEIKHKKCENKIR